MHRQKYLLSAPLQILSPGNKSYFDVLHHYSSCHTVTPALFAPLSDNLGRRPMSLFTFLIYTIACLGLAFNKLHYVPLLLLRGLQALGASASIAIAYGVIADVCVPSERGAMVGPVMSAVNLGTCIGPVVGGLITWKSGNIGGVFWALVIYGILTTILLGLLLPETARSVVGNGSQGRQTAATPYASLLQWLLLGWNWPNSTIDTENGPKTIQGTNNEIKRRRFRIPNPLSFVRIMLWKDTSLILWLSGCNYAVWCSIQASIPSIYKQIYAWNELQIGLAYLPGAVSIILAGLLNGRLMDCKYKLTAKELGFAVDKVSGDDLSKFPIVKARTRGFFYLWIVYNAALCGLGWVVQARTHPSAPLVLQATVGFVGTLFFFSFNTLLIGIHPECPGTASAAGSVMRCGLAAVGTAILQPLIDSIGRGWYFTLITIVVGGGQGAGILVLQRWGAEWGRRRLEKQKA